ncbi:helix-turn-helix domain-containing protein [Streptomyces canus]|uniref:helix-turn-helix domain-containing protein n=1 Tax=Streptomyces canus TaxID=58343 RepID=UPI0033E75F84
MAAAAEQLAAEFSQSDRHPPPAHTALHRLLDVVLLRLAHVQQHGQGAESAPSPSSAFATQSNGTSPAPIATTTTPAKSATPLAPSPAAPQTATDLSAKDYPDQRLALEARRLLAHGTEPAATIAAHLGFTSATHFGKFFHRHTGRTPWPSRASPRALPPTQPPTPPELRLP